MIKVVLFLNNPITRQDEKSILSLLKYACGILSQKHLRVRPMEGRRGPVSKKSKNITLAYTNLKKKLITIDLYTLRRRQLKKISALFRILAHEIAHFQKPPYRQVWRGKIINRQHYPTFYQQVKKNIERMKKDRILKRYFV